MAGNETITKLIGKLPYGFSDVVETGTFIGDTAKKFAVGMNWVHTIEIDERLYEFAKKGIEENGNGNVTCWLGDSAEVIPKIINDYNENHTGKKVVFYLDAHWSGDESVKEYKGGWSGPHTWIGNFSGHKGDNDNPTSKEQVPLNEEIMHIYDDFQNECMIIIDDIDKFDENGVGMTGKSFDGEDWSAVNLKTIIETIKPRITHPLEEWSGRLFIRLGRKDAL